MNTSFYNCLKKTVKKAGLININFALLLILFSSMNYSCKKFVEIPPAPNSLSTERVFDDSTTATAAVIGLYLNMSSGGQFGTGPDAVYSAMAADELIKISYSGDTEIEFYTDNLGTSNQQNYYYVYTPAYKYIFQQNACIEGLNNSNTLSTSLKSRLTGEAKFLRAFDYFYLVNYYGPVPLVTGTDYKINAALPRASVDSVYRQIIADLTDAQNTLPENYVTAGRARANSFAATALLARVYLYRKQWADAKKTASEIINNTGMYSLVANLNGVFLDAENADNTEAIWQLKSTNNVTPTYFGYTLIPYKNDVIPDYTINTPLLNAFEAGDKRRLNWIDSNIVNGDKYYYPYKYKVNDVSASSASESYTLFRVAEQYLIRAEAKAQQNNLSGAIDDLDIIRKRAGLAGTTATTQSDLLKAIYHERQVELFCEFSDRWFDLKRTGLVDQVMSVVAPQKGSTWISAHQLYPIPLSEIQSNPFLTQNPGY